MDDHTAYDPPAWLTWLARLFGRRRAESWYESDLRRALEERDNENRFLKLDCRMKDDEITALKQVVERQAAINEAYHRQVLAVTFSGAAVAAMLEPPSRRAPV